MEKRKTIKEYQAYIKTLENKIKGSKTKSQTEQTIETPKTEKPKLARQGSMVKLAIMKNKKGYEFGSWAIQKNEDGSFDCWCNYGQSHSPTRIADSSESLLALFEKAIAMPFVPYVKGQFSK